MITLITRKKQKLSIPNTEKGVLFTPLFHTHLPSTMSRVVSPLNKADAYFTSPIEERKNKQTTAKGVKYIHKLHHQLQCKQASNLTRHKMFANVCSENSTCENMLASNRCYDLPPPSVVGTRFINVISKHVC